MSLDRYCEFIGPLTSVVDSITFEHSGYHLRIHCVYNPEGEQRSFSILLHNCAQITWEVIWMDADRQDRAALLGLHTEPIDQSIRSTIATNRFELSALHERLEIQWETKSHPNQ